MLVVIVDCEARRDDRDIAAARGLELQGRAPQRKNRQARSLARPQICQPRAREIAMCRTLALLTLMLSSCAALAQPRAPAPIVLFDIAGPESAGLRDFYSKLFGWTAGPTGNLSIPVTSPLGGSLRPGDPTEKRIYIGVEDVSAKLVEVAANGGTVDAPRFEVPGVVVLGLFKDPAGNPMALVEMKDGKPRIP
jgi:predicted enzyme related to lactoylglutathione lyase